MSGLVKTVSIPADTAGAVMQALQRDANALRRTAKRRSNSGESGAAHRRRLRERADMLDRQARLISDQLRQIHQERLRAGR